MTDFDTEAEVVITPTGLDAARSDIEEQLTDDPIQVEVEGAGTRGMTRADGGGAGLSASRQRRFARREHRWARHRTQDIETAVELLDDIEGKVGGGDGGGGLAELLGIVGGTAGSILGTTAATAIGSTIGNVIADKLSDESIAVDAPDDGLPIDIPDDGVPLAVPENGVGLETTTLDYAGPEMLGIGTPSGGVPLDIPEGGVPVQSPEEGGDGGGGVVIQQGGSGTSVVTGTGGGGAGGTSRDVSTRIRQRDTIDVPSDDGGGLTGPGVGEPFFPDFVPNPSIEDLAGGVRGLFGGGSGSSGESIEAIDPGRGGPVGTPGGGAAPPSSGGTSGVARTVIDQSVTLNQDARAEIGTISVTVDAAFDELRRKLERNLLDEIDRLERKFEREVRDLERDITGN